MQSILLTYGRNMTDLMEKFQYFSRNVTDSKIIGPKKNQVSVTFLDGEIIIINIPPDLSTIEDGLPSGFADDRKDLSIIYAVLVGGINKEDPVYAIENGIFIEPK